MNRKNGYRGMLRDRCPTVVDYALKLAKAKEKWVEHSYCYFIKILGSELDLNNRVLHTAAENKRVVMKILLGLKKGKPINFDFHRTIDWDNLTKDETSFWQDVELWVNWFRTKYAYAQNAYEISRGKGKSEFDLKVELIRNYLSSMLPEETDSDEEKQKQYEYVDSCADFIIKCFNGRI